MDQQRQCLAVAHRQIGHALAAIAIGATDVSARLKPFPLCEGSTQYTFVPSDLDVGEPHHRRAVRLLLFEEMAGKAADFAYWASVPPSGGRYVRIAALPLLDRTIDLAKLLHPADERRALAELDSAYARAMRFTISPLNRAILSTKARSLRAEGEMDDFQLRLNTDALDSSALEGVPA